MTTYILGAGPTGLAVADNLSDFSSDNFVVIERSESLGGMAQSVNWDGVGVHDLGPHKIFSLNKELVQKVEGLLHQSDWITRKKISSIYMNGRYLSYPPSPFSLAGVFGAGMFFRIVVGFGAASLTKFFKTKKALSFEDDLLMRLGRPLYELLFKPIALKLWGNPKLLDIRLSKGRVQTPSIFELLVRILNLRKNSNFEALTFRYPRGGIRRLWEAIVVKCESKGKGKFLFGCNITGLVAVDMKIVEIHYEVNGIKKVIEVAPADNVISSIPLSLTTKLFESYLPAGLQALVNKTVVLNDLFLVFLHVDCDSLIDESWVFVPDPKIIFHRLSEQESFDKEMIDNGSVICCEIMNSVGSIVGNKTDEELCSEVINGLSSMGYKGFCVLNKKVVRLNQSYPVFYVGYESGLAEIIRFFDGFENFKTIGRQGAFNYIGTLDAMDVGYGCANWLIEGKCNLWKIERERTNYYQVLD